MGYLNDDYTGLSPLKTDMYQLTMAQGYFDQGRQDEEVSFYMHWRKPANDGGYTTAAGLEGIVDFVNSLKFTPERIEYLRTYTKPDKDGNPKRLFSDEFLDYLANLEPDIEIDAIPEGTAMLGQGPVVRVRTNAVLGQIVESPILNIGNSSSMIASEAAKIEDVANSYSDAIKSADRPKKIADFSLRRAATFDSSVSRSSFIGGVGAVADLEAAYQLGVPGTGTMAHAWVMGFRAAVKGYEEAKRNGSEERWVSPYLNSLDREFFEQTVRKAVDDAWPNVTNSEIEKVAFKAYLRTMPHNSVLLVDTYDTIQGIENAIQAAIEMDTPLQGIRLDSGDIYEDSFTARDMIDEAKETHPELFSATGIYVTDGLNAEKISAMENRAKNEGKELPINFYGVGTNLGNPGPFSGGVYKIAASEIIKEVTHTKPANSNEKVESTTIGGNVINFVRRAMGTMKVAEDKTRPGLPSSKSSIPGSKLNTLRLLDVQGMIVADIVIDEALRPELQTADDWLAAIKEQAIVNEDGVAQNFDSAISAEMLLKPIFRRVGKGQAAEYVYDQHGAPSKVDTHTGQAPEGDVPPERLRTNLTEIQEYARKQRTALPMQYREVRFGEKETPQAQPLYMDQKVFEARKEILQSMLPPRPGPETGGDLTVRGAGQERGAA